MSGPLLDAIVIPGVLGVWALIVVLFMVPSGKPSDETTSKKDGSTTDA